jgi:hypothetical protein
MNTNSHYITLFIVPDKILVTKTLNYCRETTSRPYHWISSSGQIDILGYQLIEQSGLPPIQETTSDNIEIISDLSAANRLLVAIESFLCKKLGRADLIESSNQIGLETRKKSNGAYLRIFRQHNLKTTDEIELDMQEVLVLERAVRNVLRTVAN